MPNKLENQITAILKAIDKGKCKNQYSAQNKVKTLKKRLKIHCNTISWNNYLAQ